MGDNPLTLELDSLFDNPAYHQVELSGVLDGNSYRLAVRYSLLEALGATSPIERPTDVVRANVAEVTQAAAMAIGRADTQELVIVTERDLGASSRDGGAGVAQEAEAHPS